MPTFKYRSRGTNNEDWHEDSLVAADEKDAKQKLDKIFGVERDETGEQTNSDLIKIELIGGESSDNN